jgi:hypothetical protein
VAGVEVVVLGEFELFSGSLPQAAANAIVAVARSASAMRLIRFAFGLVIRFSSSGKDLKSGTIIARRLIGGNGCSHRSCAGVSARAAAKASLAKWGCPISERNWER